MRNLLLGFFNRSLRILRALEIRFLKVDTPLLSVLPPSPAPEFLGLLK